MNGGESKTGAVANLPRIIVLSTIILLFAGGGAWILSEETANPAWIRMFFSYPGALFFLYASLLQVCLSFRCATLFAPGDVLRPAWMFIGLSSLARLGGDVVRLFALDSHLNPLLLFSTQPDGAIVAKAADYGPLFSPVSMLLLALGLFRVLRACRQNGILGRLIFSDILLIGLVVAYTIDFFATVVFSPAAGGASTRAQKILSWTSDPLLCVLLFQAILIRRSVSNMGWGLIARCWISFTAGIFATSLGDIGLWAWSKGYLPPFLQTASWYIWFFASAAFALGPAYQWQAMHHAKTADDGEVEIEEITLAQRRW